MSDRHDATVTYLLDRWNAGDRAAAERLMPLVYDELRGLASRVFLDERRADHTLQPTALVHEVYLALVDHSSIRWRSRGHFFSLIGCMMRRALIDHGRRRSRVKRGGRQRRVPVEVLETATLPSHDVLVALDDALQDLAANDPRKAAIVDLRYFGGLTIAETANCLDIAPKTVVREWRRAKAMLFRALVAEARDER